jgi:hypothetical protein
VSETWRLRQLEEENGQLKKIVAQQALDLDALKMGLAKKWEARGRSERRCVSYGKKQGSASDAPVG